MRRIKLGMMRKIGIESPPRWLLIVMAIIFVLVMFAVYRPQAQMPLAQQYLRLQSDTSGLGYEYTGEYDYTNVRPMAWDDDFGLTEIDGLGYMAEQWVNLDNGNLINIYVDAATGDWYMLCFNQNPQREGRIYGAHMTCGAYWVERR